LFSILRQTPLDKGQKQRLTNILKNALPLPSVVMALPLEGKASIVSKDGSCISRSQVSRFESEKEGKMKDLLFGYCGIGTGAVTVT